VRASLDVSERSAPSTKALEGRLGNKIKSGQYQIAWAVFIAGGIGNSPEEARAFLGRLADPELEYCQCNHHDDGE